MRFDSLENCVLTVTLALAIAALPAVPLQAQRADTIEVASAPASRQLLESAESKLLAGDASGAYELLSARESEFAGNAYFDYLLGMSALDSGRTSEAIFSLHRSLAVQPQFAGARMELARAYFESGNDAQARPLFATLLNEEPPAGVRSILNNYIAAIDKRPVVPASRFQGYAEAGAGYDSNANGSPVSLQFLGFTLSPDNVKTESSFGEIAAGFNYTNPRSTQLAWYASARAGYRHNPDASFVDSSVVSGLGGISWQRDRFFGRAGADGFWASRDGSSNQGWIGANALVGTRLSDDWDLTLDLRAGSLRHRSSIEVLDVDRLLATLGASYRPTQLSVISFEIVGGQDNERVSDSPYGNSKSGARISFSAPLGNAFAYASLGTLRTDFDGLFFGSNRKDDQLSAQLQLEFHNVWTDGLSLIPRVRYTDNDSDIALYTYDRTEVGLLLRWTPQ